MIADRINAITGEWALYLLSWTILLAAGMAVTFWILRVILILAGWKWMVVVTFAACIIFLAALVVAGVLP